MVINTGPVEKACAKEMRNLRQAMLVEMEDGAESIAEAERRLADRETWYDRQRHWLRRRTGWWMARLADDRRMSALHYEQQFLNRKRMQIDFVYQHDFVYQQLPYKRLLPSLRYVD